MDECNESNHVNSAKLRSSSILHRHFASYAMIPQLTIFNDVFLLRYYMHMSYPAVLKHGDGEFMSPLSFTFMPEGSRQPSRS